MVAASILRIMNSSDIEVFDDVDDRLAETVAALLPQLGMVIFKSFICQSSEAGITVGHAKALGLLFDRGRCTVGEIAIGLGVSLSSASELLDHLVTSGHVERGTNPADRRQVHVWLTPTGKRVTEEMHRRRMALVRAALHQVPSAERPIVARSLETLVTVLRQQLDASERDVTIPECPRIAENR